MNDLLEKGIKKVERVATTIKMNEIKPYIQSLLMSSDKKVMFIKNERNYHDKESVMKIADLVALEDNRDVKIAIGEKASSIEDALANFSISTNERRFAGVVLSDAKAEYNKELKLAKQNNRHYENNSRMSKGF